MMRRSSSTSSIESLRPRASSRRGRVGGGGGVEGQRDQHGALALDQVVAGGLAGRLRVAEDAEQVVAQLEGLAERQPERRQRVEGRGSRAGQRGADVQRPLDGVLRRLVAQHGHRGVDVGPAAGLHGHVEELPGDHLRAAQVEQVERRPDPVPRQPAAAQHLVGPAQQQVAEQDRRGGAVLLRVAAPAVAAVLGAERAVGGRPAAAGVGGVHVVVVHQRAGVQQLEGGAGADQCRVVGGGRVDGAVAPVAERGPEPLAAAHRHPRLGHQAGGVGAQRGEACGLLVEEAVERRLDPRAEALAVPPRPRTRHVNEPNDWTFSGPARSASLDSSP